MNIRNLQYLVALSDHEHFGKAAEECFVSQPALSIQINKLEEYLGVKLLERTNKSVALTAVGLIITEQARQILSQVSELKEIAQTAKDPFNGELKLGIFPTLAPYLFPYIIPKLSAIFPNLLIYLIEEKTELLMEKLKQGKIHAAITALPMNESGMTTTPLFEEEFLLTISHSHALAKRKTIKHEELDSKNILILEDGHCMRDQVLSFCHQANATETLHFRATSLEALRHMVAAGSGMTLMPRLATEGCKLATFIPFTSPKPMRTIGITSRKCSTKKILLDELSQQIKKIMAKTKLVNVID
ncbi:MAG: LysR substrate-binding domain-containing protein [Gammaproteobacteria bacterium]|nr:LysR substrate-binding domain-containing protein [Gammaproteobacteria bacterium]